MTEPQINRLSRWGFGFAAAGWTGIAIVIWLFFEGEMRSWVFGIMSFVAPFSATLGSGAIAVSIFYRDQLPYRSE